MPVPARRALRERSVSAARRKAGGHHRPLITATRWLEVSVGYARAASRSQTPRLWVARNARLTVLSLTPEAAATAAMGNAGALRAARSIVR